MELITLTVADLIAELQQLPGDLPVCRHDSDYGARTIEGAKIRFAAEGRYLWAEEEEEAARSSAADLETAHVLRFVEIR